MHMNDTCLEKNAKWFWPLFRGELLGIQCLGGYWVNRSSPWKSLHIR